MDNNSKLKKPAIFIDHQFDAHGCISTRNGSYVTWNTSKAQPVKTNSKKLVTHSNLFIMPQDKYLKRILNNTNKDEKDLNGFDAQKVFSKKNIF